MSAFRNEHNGYETRTRVISFSRTPEIPWRLSGGLHVGETTNTVNGRKQWRRKSAAEKNDSYVETVNRA